MSGKYLRLRWVVYILLLGVWLLWFLHQRVDDFSRYIVNDCLRDLDHQYQAALVLGAGVNEQEQASPIFSDRLETANALYKAGAVRKIIVSGDHGTVNYDEVNTGKEYLISKNIPAEDIFLDHAGFDTYDSLYRARDIFHARKILIVTQDFHLPRSLYIARRLGVDALGCRADGRFYLNINYLEKREWLASVKAWFDINLRSKPHFLGETFDLEGDGKLTWDLL